MKISSGIKLAFSMIGIVAIIGFSIWGAAELRDYFERNTPKTNTIVIDKGNSVKLQTRDELDIYLIERYKEHLKWECDTVELKVVNDVLESRYDMP